MNVNLLPWRARRRIMRGWWHMGLLVMVIMVLCVAQHWGDQRLGAKVGRLVVINRGLNAKLHTLQRREANGDSLAAQQQWDHFQAHKNALIVVLQQLVRALTATTTLSALKMFDEKMTISGVCKSQADMATLLKKITSARLILLKKTADGYRFELEVIIP